VSRAARPGGKTRSYGSRTLALRPLPSTVHPAVVTSRCLSGASAAAHWPARQGWQGHLYGDAGLKTELERNNCFGSQR